ncbi:Transcriptional regulator RPN4 [Paramyrothecium foliicola]|nr:Transcriptional regulator RPN4 [Paramyrothecium foliicola]
MLSLSQIPYQQQQHSKNAHISHNHFDQDRTYNAPRDFINYSDFDQFSSQSSALPALPDELSTDAMQSDAWSGLAQFTPKLNRFSHHRESSLSSLGSTTGPASPFNHSTSNPQIAVTDSTSDGLNEMHSHDGSASHGNANSYYQLAKSMNSYPGYQSLDHTMPELAYPVTIPGPNNKPRGDRGLLPAPDFINGANRSHPASVASSIAGDSPATPTAGEGELDRRRKGMPQTGLNAMLHSLTDSAGFGAMPKLDRTMTDVYSDELYSPNFAITSTSPPQSRTTTSPTNDIFHQRINAANSQHLSAAQSPASSASRGRSPFRTGSPMAPSPSHDFVSGHPSSIPFNSAQRIREQNKVQQEAQLYQQQMAQATEPETPKTISPKDAILEFTEPEGGEPSFPLFPQESNNFEMDHLAKQMVPQADTSMVSCPQPPIADQNGVNHQLYHLPSHLPTGIEVPQQYPFIARVGPNHDTPPRLSSAGSSSLDSGSTTPVVRQRPAGTGAEGGTYTCTYHGCTLRFETPALLQKHKREGHRQTQGLGAPRPHELVGMTSSVLNSQAGPHRCDRINPGTGKPCNTVFSRPYDLTRHEDTIHNARKQKVRCNLCTEEKTFSRADALTRHYRVCHPDVELPGKHRRRGGV